MKNLKGISQSSTSRVKGLTEKRMEKLIERGARLARAWDCCIALMSRYYVGEPWHHPELDAAARACKLMFAFVERGVDWSEYRRYPWTMVFEFDRDDIGELKSHLRKVREWMEFESYLHKVQERMDTPFKKFIKLNS